jgi:hypothetical protein
MRALLGALALLAGAPARTPPVPPPDLLPFGPGERFEFGVKLGVISFGIARMEVVAPDTVDGHLTWKIRMLVDIGSLVYDANDTLESWFDPAMLVSRRFEKRFRNSKQHRNRLYSFRPEDGIYTRADKDTVYATPLDVLDDVSFLYLVRTLPLDVGHTYEFPRYYDIRKNPLVVRVLRRETMELPDKSRVPCLVLAPVIGTTGLFRPQAKARLWLTDDARRIPVQIKADIGVGDGTLRLRKMTLAPTEAP